MLKILRGHFSKISNEKLLEMAKENVVEKMDKRTEHILDTLLEDSDTTSSYSL